MAEWGECGEASAETWDKESVDPRAHVMARPETHENTDYKTSDHIDRKGPGGIFVSEELLSGNAGEVSAAGAGKTA